MKRPAWLRMRRTGTRDSGLRNSPGTMKQDRSSPRVTLFERDTSTKSFCLPPQFARGNSERENRNRPVGSKMGSLRIAVPPPACRCSLCRQLPQGCRCRANRTVFPPDRIRSLRSNPGFGQFDETPGEVNIAPRGDEFATPWTESPPFRSKSSPELPMPAQSNGKVWQFPGTALPLSARPLMRPTHHVRPVAVSPRPRYEPVFGDESDFVPELSLPE
jgi:hypothetical protein